MSQFAFTVEHRPALMLTECDTLSRYNTTVNTWRETNPTADLALTTSPQATNLSLSPPPCLSVLLTMRPPRFLGTPVGPTAPQDHLRTTLASGALTVPLSNAYLAAGISPQSISYIDFLSNDLLMLPPTDYASKHQPAPVWLDAFWLNIDIGPPLDWFIAFYTPALADPPALQPVTGKTDEDFLSWRNQHLQLARSLISKCGTRAVILATPRTWPDPFRHCSTYSPPGWKAIQLRLHNTQHGGHIETCHDVLCLLPHATADAFALPDHTTAQPGPMSAKLDPAGLDPDTLWTQDLAVTLPDAITQAIESPTPFSARVANLVKYQADAVPVNGYPTFSINGPAPSIAHF